MNQVAADVKADQLRDVFRDPSLSLALGLGVALSTFLLIAHGCCLGLTDQHFAALSQICSIAG